MAQGVKLIFAKLDKRFKEKASLLAVGRKLSMEEQSSRPWTELEFIGTRTTDTFDDDIEYYTVRFTYHGKQQRADGASDWLEEMKDAFDDYYTLAPVGFTCGGIERLAADDGPARVDGVFEATADFEIMLTRTTNKPAVRGA